MSEPTRMYDDSCACPEAGKWKIDDSLSGYAGEVVLVCSYCGLRYYNAQEFFPKEELDAIEHINCFTPPTPQGEGVRDDQA